MKKLLFLLIVSSVLIACRSQNNTLSQFSKRKYLKRFKSAKKAKEEPLNTYALKQKEMPDALYAAEEIQPEQFVLNEIEEDDYSELVLPQRQHVAPLKKKKIYSF